MHVACWLIIFCLLLWYIKQDRKMCNQWAVSPAYAEKEKLMKTQKKLSKMLKQFDAFCKREGIKYWSMYGTLLGAIRHKGWIPWDADLDISMLDSDYEKLLAVRNKLPSSLFLQDRSTDKNYTRNTGKIRELSSCYIWPNSNTHDGFMIDIFTYKREGDTLVPVRPTSNPHLRKVPVSEIFPLTSSWFDGIRIPVPRDYRGILEKSYGKNYMDPPIEAERIPHEGNFGNFDPDQPCSHHTPENFPKIY